MKPFNLFYNDTLNDLKKIMNNFDLSLFSRHNRGFQSYRSNDELIEAFQEEKNRYEKSFDFIFGLYKQNAFHCLLDIGCLFGIFPMILRRAGLDLGIHVIDNYSFYGESLNPIRELLRSFDIEVHDKDVLQGIPFSENSFTIVTLLAVIEHFSFSPLSLLHEIRRILRDGGYLILDTPNVGSMNKRLNFFFRGIPPYANLEDFLFSEKPFTGHCREYSRQDVVRIMEYTGYHVEITEQFNIGTFKNMNLRSLFLQRLLPRIFPDMRNYIWCVGRPKYD